MSKEPEVDDGSLLAKGGFRLEIDFGDSRLEKDFDVDRREESRTAEEDRRNIRAHRLNKRRKKTREDINFAVSNQKKPLQSFYIFFSPDMQIGLAI